MAADYEGVFESIRRRQSSPHLVAEPLSAGENRLIG
jgi:hypothetical protein